MAPQQLSPHTPSASTSIPPAQPKRNVFGMSSTNRRQSLGSHPPAANAGSPSLAVAASPLQPTTPAGSGIPSFRALRSLLPFGASSKNSGPSLAIPTPVTPASSKGSFGFGSVRRSINLKDRERKMSLTETRTPQVLAIERSNSDSQVEDTNIRRSVSLSHLDEPSSARERDTNHPGSRAPVLRTPSPGVPLSLELSTIIEADSSGVSRHKRLFSTDSSPTESRAPSPTILKPIQQTQANTTHDSTPSTDYDADTSPLNLTPAQLKREVMDAMRASDSPAASARDWSAADKVVIDADGPDSSFSMEPSILPAVDPDLAALLSPNTLAAKTSRRNPPSQLPRLRTPLRSPATSPTSLLMPKSPVTPTSPGATATPRHSPSREKPWGLSPSKSPPSPTSPGSPSLSTSTPAANRRAYTSNPTHLFTPAASSSLSQSTGSKLFNPTKSGSNIGKGRPSAMFRNILGSSSRSDAGGLSPSLPTISLSTPPSPSRASALARGSLDSRRSPVRSTFQPRRTSLDIPRPPLEGTNRRPSFEVRRGPASSRPKANLFSNRRSSASPEPPSTIILESSPSPVASSRNEETSSGRRSFDSARPSSAARVRDREWHQSSSSLRPNLERRGTQDRLSPVPHSGSSNAGSATSSTYRTRKRSMSVQERLGRSKLGQTSTINGHTDDFGINPPSTAPGGSGRPSTSMSVGYSRRGEPSSAGAGDSAPRPDWLSSRLSSKAFRAAALLDREQRDLEAANHGTGNVANAVERPRFFHRERSGSLTTHSVQNHSGLGPSPLGTGTGRFGSVRGTASDYNPSHQGPRTHSRMALSDAGDGPVEASQLDRRGSERISPSFQGGSASAGGNGLMESPTFTTSSGSRDRASTAATSISGYGGARDRRDSRDRFVDELRDLREKHATEMEALLSALSDSQRTARMLREENTRLRDRVDRLEGLEAENDELAHVCSELRMECAQLSRENEALRSELEPRDGRWDDEEVATPQWKSASARTPVARQNGRYQQAHRQEERSRLRLNVPSSERLEAATILADDEDAGDFDRTHDTIGEETQFSSASRAHQPQLARRLSTSSSIFPIPPSNMSMLIDGTAGVDQYRFPDIANGTFASNGSPHASPRRKPASISSRMQSPPRTARGKGGAPGYDYRRNSQNLNMSISSAHNISPTTANFSILSGSPGSLYLKPEHEMLLEDMESLDLGNGVAAVVLNDETDRMQGSGWY